MFGFLITSEQEHAVAELPVSTIYLLKRAELAARGCAELALAGVDLTPSQFFILVLVKSGEATSSAELARAMGVLPQSMTELLAPLEASGAVVRRPDPKNRRILRIALTAAGERRFERGLDVAMRLEREIFEGVSKQDRLQLNRLLLELTIRAEAHELHPSVRRLKAARRAPETRTPIRRRTQRLK